MNEHSRISEDDYMRSLQEYRNRFLNGSKTAGFYIQLAFVVGTVGIIAAKGVWNVMWTVLVALLLLLGSTVVKPAAWNWTERMLRRDAEEGRLTRAVWWDYLSVLIDALDCFGCSAIVSVAVFALDAACWRSHWPGFARARSARSRSCTCVAFRRTTGAA